ncbi:placenta-expressed transcript 1 protein [Mustela nigripes]|uniref:placenta-expressed transcript 1 protein n=1 Tax=Mustela nigripes TaxID=77151 RepID=UPI002816526C|nr:placenta-expressed transcript 1 protein [Mustela nigripes]
MTVLSSMLLPLWLFLCFGLLCSSASSAGDIDNCVLFNEVITTGQGIMANSDVYESNTNYTVWVPVNASVSSVVLRAVDANNNSLGLWEKADKVCRNSALYRLDNQRDQIFMANWVSPNSTNITTVALQAFSINFYNAATFSSLQLGRKGALQRIQKKKPGSDTECRILDKGYLPWAREAALPQEASGLSAIHGVSSESNEPPGEQE